MQITVEVDDSVVKHAVRQAWSEMFGGPVYSSGSRATGYVVLRKQLEALIEAMDFSAELRKTIASELPAALREVVGLEIRKKLKQTVKDMRSEGSLFEEGGKA